jgi:hypothetical protein
VGWPSPTNKFKWIFLALPYKKKLNGSFLLIDSMCGLALRWQTAMLPSSNTNPGTDPQSPPPPPLFLSVTLFHAHARTHLVWIYVYVNNHFLYKYQFPIWHTYVAFTFMRACTCMVCVYVYVNAKRLYYIGNYCLHRKLLLTWGRQHRNTCIVSHYIYVCI